MIMAVGPSEMIG